MAESGGGGGLRKFGLLLWKNYILQKRHNIQTVFEILLPLLFTIILVIIRGLIDSDTIDHPTYYPEFHPNSANGTFVYGGKYVLYAPNTSAINNIIFKMEQEFKNSPDTDPPPAIPPCKPNKHHDYLFIGYPNEQDLLDAYLNNQTFADPGNKTKCENENLVLGAIVFKSDPTSNDIKYTLRFPANQHKFPTGNIGDDRGKWYTELLYSLFQTPGPRAPLDDDIKGKPEKILENWFKEHGGTPGYFMQGFLFLQSMIDTAILKDKAERKNIDPSELENFDIFLERFPYPKYIDDIFIIALQSQLPLFLVLSFIYTVINISKSIVHEKERRLKESMKMMGLPNWLHWCAWFTKSYVFLLASAILMTILYKVPFYGDGLAVLSYADGSLLFVFLLCYLWSVVTLGFLVSTFFSAANSASIAAGVIFFITYFPYIFLEPRYDELKLNTKLGLSIFSNTAMAFGCRIITMFEGTGAGIKWSTIAKGASPDDNMSLLDVMIALIVDGLIYLLLSLYIEGVFPGDYGVPLPWYFPFTKSYWCGGSSDRDDTHVHPSDSPHKNNHLFEKEPSGKAGIKILGLTKVFGKKVAVNNLHLNFYDNQVTTLLGHNGAGKTTTMSMITGLFPPSGGTVIVNGYDIRTDIKSVRDSLGLCPQHDVLFDEMTVEEHLRFFCLLKGYDRSLVQNEIDRMLVALKLENKRHAQSQTLSGGMKRKLSVGIALCGGSKVVLLDEPTSGMDPGARRSTWDLISNEKKGRTIVLSTHFMDEADLLGDRIAIMAHGEAQCCGSSLFLKKKYGGGYHLIIVKGQNCQVNKITEILQRRMPEVEVDQDIGAELSYSLPDGKSYMFPEMFEELEARKPELGIDSYGCSITQMEEVFMRVGEQVEAAMNENQANNNGLTNSPSKTKLTDYRTIDMASDNMPATSNSTSTFKLSQDSNDSNSGFTLVLQQLRAMLVKKGLYSIRNKALLAVQTLIPVVFLIISLIVVQTMPGIGSPKERSLDLADYTLLGKPVTTMECSQSPTGVCKAYEHVAALQSTVENTTMFEDYIIAKSEESLPRVTFQYLVGLKSTVSGTRTKLNGFFNNQPYHTPPVALNFIWNSVMRTVTKTDDLKLSVANFPLPFTSRDEIENLSSSAGQSEGFQIGFNVSFGMSFLAASFVVFLIKERETKSKHLQFVSGVKFPIFWLAHLIFDSINYLIPCFALMIVLVAFQTDDFSSGKMQGLFLFVLIMYGWSVIPLMYLFSFLFTVPASGFTRMIFFNFISGVATLLAVTILKIPDLNLVEVGEALEWPFMFLPNFNVGYAITQLSYNSQLQKICPTLSTIPGFCNARPDFPCCTEYPVNYLSWKAPGIGRNMFFMFLVGLLCHLVLMIIESKIIQKIMYRNEAKKHESGTFERDASALEDNDVEDEAQRIRTTDLDNLFRTDNLILRDLTKYYGKFLAVDRLCLGVKQGECFGLLGVNGAGKTTTFKMLTGDIPITLGEAFVTNKSVKSDIKEVQKVIGYCPQFDALIPDLTGRETIRLFARLRGVREEEIDALVDRLGADLLFTEHIEKPCGTYSGGNKRKLSTALALIGNPPLVFLDEPTTGMDPVARRHLWNTIIRVRERGNSVILTSHSMEECEALCTRLAIMVNGKFRCLGSTQHLKNKFGEGYAIIAQIESGTDDTKKRTRSSLELGRRRSSLNSKPEHWEQELQPLRNFIERNFPGCQLKDIHPAYVHYHIPEDGAVTWGEMFKKMEEAKVLFKLEAYSVGQTSLEQVFLGFAKGQCNDEDE